MQLSTEEKDEGDRESIALLGYKDNSSDAPKTQKHTAIPGLNIDLPQPISANTTNFP